MKIGLAQIDVAWELKEKNKEKCLKFIKESKKEDVDILFFPELTLTGFSMNIEKIYEEEQETVDWFKNQAKLNNLHIGFGFAEKYNDRGKNNFSIVTPYGTEIIRYTKIHPFSFGHEDKYYDSGQSILSVQIKEFSLTPFICYDLRFPEIFQFASKNSSFIIVIANWPNSRRSHWTTLLKARAIENQCYVAGVNRVGTGNKLTYSGDSVIFDPLGEVEKERIVLYDNSLEKFFPADLDNIISEEKKHSKECLIISELRLEKVLETQKTFPLKKDRKESFYRSLY